MISEFAMGHLGVRIIGNQDPIARYVHGEFASLPPLARNPDLEIDFSNAGRRIQPTKYLKSGPLMVSPDQVLATYKRFRVNVVRTDGCLSAGVTSDLGSFTNPVLSSAVRMVDPSFLNAPERLAKTFIYAVFDVLAQIAQLSLGQSWVHASCASTSDRAVAFLAWGGVGKTSVLLKLLQTGDWRFLSDDLMPLDESGRGYVTPKRMQVYAYNLASEELLAERLLAGRGIVDRSHFLVRRTVLGAAKARRRVSAQELFGDNVVCESAQLTDAILMRRSSSKDFGHSIIDPKPLAHVAASTLVHELQLLTTLAAAAGAVGVESAIPSMDKLFAQSLDVLTNAFSRIPQLHVMDIPLDARPADIADNVLRLLNFATEGR